MRRPATPGHGQGRVRGEERDFGVSPPSTQRFSRAPVVYRVLALHLGQAGDRDESDPGVSLRDSQSGGGSRAKGPNPE